MSEPKHSRGPTLFHVGMYSNAVEYFGFDAANSGDIMNIATQLHPYRGGM